MYICTEQLNQEALMYWLTLLPSSGSQSQTHTLGLHVNELDILRDWLWCVVSLMRLI